MRRYLMNPGSLAAVVASLLVLTPTAALGQRGTSSSAEPAPETVEQAQPAPNAMRRGQLQSGQRGQTQRARLAERDRLEQMREHIVAGMRRMATRLAAVQDRIQALDRGEPDAAPPVEMGPGMRAEGERGMQKHGMQKHGMRGQGMQRQGMQSRDGAASECLRMQPTDEDSDVSSEGADR